MLLYFYIIVFLFKQILLTQPTTVCNQRTKRARELIDIIKFQSATWTSITKSISYALGVNCKLLERVW